MKQTTKDIKKVQGGYSDIRLWPCYSLVGFSMLFLMPKLGLIFSHLLIYAVVVLATAWALPRMPVKVSDFEAWRADVDIAIANGTKQPSLDDYGYMENKKVKAVKQPHQKAPQFKLAPAKAFNS